MAGVSSSTFRSNSGTRRHLCSCSWLCSQLEPIWWDTEHRRTQHMLHYPWAFRQSPLAAPWLHLIMSLVMSRERVLGIVIITYKNDPGSKIDLGGGGPPVYCETEGKHSHCDRLEMTITSPPCGVSHPVLHSWATLWLCAFTLPVDITVKKWYRRVQRNSSCLVKPPVPRIFALTPILGSGSSLTIHTDTYSSCYLIPAILKQSTGRVCWKTAPLNRTFCVITSCFSGGLLVEGCLVCRSVKDRVWRKGWSQAACIKL